MENYICIDIGGTRLKYARILDDGEIKDLKNISTPKSLENLLDCIKIYMKSSQITPLLELQSVCQD